MSPAAADKLLVPLSRPGAEVDPDALAADVALDGVEIVGINSPGSRGKLLETKGLAGSITEAVLERKRKGASTLTLTVHDASRELLQASAFDPNATVPLELVVDDLAFWLVQIAKSGNMLTLTFEDREVAVLRRYRKPRKMSRDKVTRAQFARLLVREAKIVNERRGADDVGRINFFSPELNVRQPVGSKAQTVAQRVRDRQRAPGFAPGAKITVKGKRADAAQRKILSTVLQVAESVDAPKKVKVALVAAVIVESVARNLKGGDRDSVGILQQRNMRPWNRRNRRDPAAAATTFIEEAMKVYRRKPSHTPATLAQAVQRSAFPAAYKTRQAEAERIVAAFEGGTAAAVKRQRYEFSRGEPGGAKGEDTWAALQRLAEEVRWSCFVVAGTVYFISDDALMKSRPRMTISEGAQGVLAIDWDVDSGKPANEATVTARAARWAAPPGSVVVVEGEGPANGRWIVDTISRSLFNRNASITLVRAQPKLPEPAPETETVGGGGTAGFAEGLDRRLGAIYKSAVSIGKKGLRYSYGGGHSSIGRPTGGNRGAGYDCSGSVSAILHAAGLLDKPMTTYGFLKWGKKGRGKHFTIYVNEKHMFVEFHLPGKSPERWGAEVSTGVGFKKDIIRAGYEARHIKGL